MKKFLTWSLCVFILAWLGVGCFFLFPGCNYSAMPQREVTEEYRFYNFKVKAGEILVVHLVAKHEQDLAWLKSNEDYDLISVDKTYRNRPGTGGRYSRPIADEAIKIYLQPKRSFLLNWSYTTAAGARNTLYTKIEIQ